MPAQLDQLLNELLSTGKVPSHLIATVKEAMSDPKQLDEVLAQLKAMGADQIGDGPPLNIADYYRPGPGAYELRWKLPPELPLPVAFADLDRKTQFFVLFQEWSRREMEGLVALNGGDVDGAEQIFHECAERAKQIDVDELVARSYEDQRRVAQRRGDLVGEKEWSRKAAAVRKG
jgi:hypothetical protein